MFIHGLAHFACAYRVFPREKKARLNMEMLHSMAHVTLWETNKAMENVRL